VLAVGCGSTPAENIRSPRWDAVSVIGVDILNVAAVGCGEADEPACDGEGDVLTFEFPKGSNRFGLGGFLESLFINRQLRRETRRYITA
jgi:hypothetical protein